MLFENQVSIKHICEKNESNFSNKKFAMEAAVIIIAIISSS